ncbi:conserved Plasmodium protein, unknown function [Plasmodium sp. gorilla clade G3]|nr:conserved Plasmodium protein, unknown function [Plasmodium sp. gorilla clade G3]
MNENNVKEMNNKNENKFSKIANENPCKKKGDEKLSETASYKKSKKSSYIDNLYNKKLNLCEVNISYCDKKKKENTNLDEEKSKVTVVDVEKKKTTNVELQKNNITNVKVQKNNITNVKVQKNNLTNVKDLVEHNLSTCKNVLSTKMMKGDQKDKYNIRDMKGKNNLKNNTSSPYIKTKSLQNVKKNSMLYSNDKTRKNNSQDLEDHKDAFSSTNGNSLSFDGIDINNIKLNIKDNVNDNNDDNDDNNYDNNNDDNNDDNYDNNNDGNNDDNNDNNYDNNNDDNNDENNDDNYDNNNDDSNNNNNYYYYNNTMNEEKNEKEEVSFNISEFPNAIGTNMGNYILEDEDNYNKSSFDKNDFDTAIGNTEKKDGLKQRLNIFNEEINSHDLRRNNKDIIANIEKSSRYYKEKKDSFLSTLKLKGHDKKEVYTSNINEAKDDEIMIQTIFIEQNDNNDNVQNKIDSIEQTIEENKNVKYNNMLSNKTGNILKKQSDIIQKVICEEENYSSSSTNVASHIGNKHGDSNSFNKRDYEITDGEIMENHIKNDKHLDDQFGEAKHLNDHIPSDELTSEISNIISSPNIQLSEDSLENTREKSENVTSNYAENFVDIKIYDEDSEIDDIQNNELDYFWNNKDVSNILNKERNSVRKSFEGNNEENEKILWNSKGYIGGLSIGSIDFPNFNIKKKNDKIIFPQMRRSRSDNIYKRKNIAHHINKRNTIDNIVNNENMEISLSNNEYIYNNNNNNDDDDDDDNNNNLYYANNRLPEKKEEQTDDMNIADKLDIIKKKLAINNNIDIDNINYERFDMYQVDFEKIGLNVSSLEKEEKYILLLYISEKKLEYVWNEREAFKRAHSNIKNFQVNQNKMRELKNEKRENAVLIDTQYFKSNDMKNYETYILNKKNNHDVKYKSSNNCGTNNTNIISNIDRSISVTSSFDMYEKKYNLKDFSLLLERHKYNNMRNYQYDEKMNSDDYNDIISNDEKIQDGGFFLPFYRKLLKKYETINHLVINNDITTNDVVVTNNTTNNNIYNNNNNNNNICNHNIFNMKYEGDNSHKYMSNEKALFEKFLKSFISLFFQDECIDQFLNYYEDIRTSKNEDDALLAHSLCIEYMCNCFQDIYVQKDYIENEEKKNWFLHFSVIIKDIINNFIENENLVNKIRKIQIINNILKDEVKTYSIKVAHEDIYLDVSQNFIEDYENVIVSKDIGFFNIYMLDKNYKYNYHIYMKQRKKTKSKMKMKKSNDNINKYVHSNNQINYTNSFWSYIFGYFNNIYNNWSQEKEDTDTSSYSNSGESLQKDIINSSNFVIQNFSNSDEEESGDISVTTDDENYSNLDEQKWKNKNKSNIKNEHDIEHTILHKRSKQCYEEKVSTHEILLRGNKKNKNKEKYKNDDSNNSKDMKSVDINILQNDEGVDTNINNKQLNNYMNNKIKFNNLENQDHILVNCINKNENIIESNLSNVSFHNSGNSNNIKLDDFYVVNKKEEMKYNTTKDEEQSEMLNNNNNNDDNSCNNIHKNRNNHIPSYKNCKCNNKKYVGNIANLVSFQYKGSLPKENIHDLKKMNKNKNIIGCYFSSSDHNLVAVHIKSEMVQDFVDTHFVMERCRKYNKQIKKSYVHILNANKKQYLAVNLNTNKIIYTNKYDDTIYLDEYNEQHKISTYFQLQSISDMMKNILIEDIVQSVADILC